MRLIELFSIRVVFDYILAYYVNYVLPEWLSFTSSIRFSSPLANVLMFSVASEDNWYLQDPYIVFANWSSRLDSRALVISVYTAASQSVSFVDIKPFKISQCCFVWNCFNLYVAYWAGWESSFWSDCGGCLSGVACLVSLARLKGLFSLDWHTMVGWPWNWLWILLWIWPIIWLAESDEK